MLKIRTVLFALSFLILLTQKTMTIPLPLVLQKTLLVSTYAYGTLSLAQRYKWKWLPKSMRWQNKLVKKTKKDIQKKEVELEGGLMDVLTLAQRSAFFAEKKMCNKYAPHLAKRAEKISLELMVLPLRLSASIVKPLLAYHI